MNPSRLLLYQMQDLILHYCNLQCKTRSKYKQKQEIAENVNTDQICLVSKPLQNSTWHLLANTSSGTVLANILHYSFRLFRLKLKLFVLKRRFVWISAVAIKPNFKLDFVQTILTEHGLLTQLISCLHLIACKNKHLYCPRNK